MLERIAEEFRMIEYCHYASVVHQVCPNVENFDSTQPPSEIFLNPFHRVFVPYAKREVLQFRYVKSLKAGGTSSIRGTVVVDEIFIRFGIVEFESFEVWERDRSINKSM